MSAWLGALMRDLNKLFHAVTVAREGSFAAAAKTIPMSQSALTRSVQSLERRYAIRLFERGKTGAHLTHAGVAFIAAAEDILWGAERDDERLLAVARGQNETVRFGAGPTVTACILPQILPALAAMPVRYKIHIGTNVSLRLLLSRGEIDFFIGGVAEGSDHFSTAHGFRLDPVGGASRSVELYMRPGHPLAQAPLTRENLGKYPVACESYARDRLGPDGFEALGLQRPSIEIDDYHVLTGLVSASDFILVANRTVGNLESARAMTVRSLDTLDLHREWTWAIVSSDRSPLSTPAAAVIDALRNYINELGRDSSAHRP